MKGLGPYHTCLLKLRNITSDTNPNELKNSIITLYMESQAQN